MRFLIRLAVLALLTTSIPSQAARTEVDFRWSIDLVGFTASLLGLQLGGAIDGSAVFEDVAVDPVARTVVIPADSPPGGASFRVTSGVLAFDQSDDQFGGPMMRLDAAGRVVGVEFLPGPISLAGGDYLLSFSGSQFTLTPSATLADILASGQLQPIPGPSEQLVAMLGACVASAVALRRARRSRRRA
jgi:hypothetical protein